MNKIATNSVSTTAAPTNDNNDNDAISSPAPFWMPRRAIFAFAANSICIYIDFVASNYALERWTRLSLEQKAALPDIVHDNFAFYENHFLKEFPTALMYFVVAFLFMVPYDIMGRSPSPHDASYTRGECCIRFLETRCLLELMRACTVFATTMSDPHGLHCMEIESHEMENIWTTFTLARCGDNIFSGHAGHLLSPALCIQTYFLPMKFSKQGAAYRILTAALWISVVCLSFYVVVSRMHYTVDVLVSCFLVPSVWFAWVGVTGGSSSSSSGEAEKSKVQ